MDKKPPTKSEHDNSSGHKQILIENSEKLKNNNGWSLINEKEVFNMGQMSMAYSWMHHRCNRLFSKYDRWITIAVMFLSSVLIIPQLIDPEDIEYKQTFRIFNIILQVAIAALSGYRHITNYAARSQTHKEAAQQFTRIHDIIRQQLLLYRRDRAHANEFIEYQSSLLDIYTSGSPEIDDKIIKLFKEKFKDTDIELPIFMNDKIEQFSMVSPVEPSTVTSSTPPRPTSQVTPWVYKTNCPKIGLEEDDEEAEADTDTLNGSSKITKLRFEMNRLRANTTGSPASRAPGVSERSPHLVLTHEPSISQSDLLHY
jgi:hypothetical protein